MPGQDKLEFNPSLFTPRPTITELLEKCQAPASVMEQFRVGDGFTGGAAVVAFVQQQDGIGRQLAGRDTYQRPFWLSELASRLQEYGMWPLGK